MHGIQRSAIKHSGSSKKVEMGFLKLNSFNAIFSTFLFISLFFKDFFVCFFRNSSDVFDGFFAACENVRFKKISW